MWVPERLLLEIFGEPSQGGRLSAIKRWIKATGEYVVGCALDGTRCVGKVSVSRGV